MENVSTTEIPAGVELDFTAWLRHLERRDLSDPAEFAAVVRELALDPHRTEYAEYIGSRQSLMSDMRRPLGQPGGHAHQRRSQHHGGHALRRPRRIGRAHRTGPGDHQDRRGPGPRKPRRPGRISP